MRAAGSAADRGSPAVTLARTPEGIRVTGWLATLDGNNVGDGTYESEQVAVEVAEDRASALRVEQTAGASYIDEVFPVEALLEYVDPEDMPR